MTLRGAPGRLRSGLAAEFDALVPVACVVCGRGSTGGRAPVCRLCRTRLSRIPLPRCPRCGEPAGRGTEVGAGGASASGSDELLRCGACEEWPPGPSGAAAPFVYAGGAARIVRALKFGGWRRLASFMAREMRPEAVRLVRRYEGRTEGSVVLVPVPLSPSRLRERGFNQALDLARGLSASTGWPVAEVLRRVTGGAAQARLGYRARARNVAGRFSPVPGSGVPAPVPSDPVRREEAPLAMIVDDVLTTGATAFACASALAEAGFDRTAVVTFARTLRPLGTGARGSTRNSYEAAG